MSGALILAADQLTDESGARWVAVCSQARLTEQRIVCASVEGVGILIIRDGDRIYACERACPHEQADLGLGRVADGQLHCPRHLARFDLGDGRISPGWPSRDLRLYPVRIVDEQVWIDTGAVQQH